VVVDDIIGEYNLLEGLGSGDDYFTGAKNACGNLLHVLRWLELHLHCRVSVGFERHFEHVRVFFKMVSGFHEVNVIVETKVRVYHHNTERIHWGYHIGVKKSENVFKAGDDMFTVDDIVAPSHLDTPIWENLDRLGTVTIFVCQCDLVVKGCGF
jgi:hypothetical protein|tara:strand:+ start:997 stop:1458 length:462 start_codon:yes stop_codon:yes gene_type:complete